MAGAPEDRRFVFQGVHMLFSGSFEDPWPVSDKERESTFVFIGRNLDRDRLRAGFEACLARPLRFAVGAKIRCRTDKGWEDGVILRHWDEGNAFRIATASGDEVWAPQDIDDFVKAK
jgi:hypothetical protein